MFIKIPIINFVGIRRYAITFSVLLTIIGFFFLIYRGGFNMGLDFKGGISIQVKASPDVQSESIRTALKKHDVDSVIQVFGKADRNEFLIKTLALDKDNMKAVKKIEDIISQEFGNEKVQILATEMVGPTMGKYMTQQAFWLVVIACGLILIYVTIRFQFDFALGAILSLVHDVLVALTFVLIFDKEMTVSIIAALLTIIGYSINDTIVVYDRIREGLAKYRDLSFNDIVNKSINETLNRTVVTVVTVLMAAMALFIWGGPVLHDFSFVLIVGITTGMYSSIFIASPVIIELHALRDKMKLKKQVYANK